MPNYALKLRQASAEAIVKQNPKLQRIGCLAY